MPHMPASFRLGSTSGTTYRVLDSRRGTARERGYDWLWERIRKVKLAMNPICERCRQSARYRPATLVHHIQPLGSGGNHAMENLMAVCRDCHAAIHAEIDHG